MKTTASIKLCTLAIALALAVLFSTQCVAQNKKIDSTIEFINTYKPDDTLKVQALLFVSDTYQTSNLKKSLYYGKLANNIAEKIGNKRFIALSLSRLGSINTWYGKSNEALALYFKEIAIAKSINASYLLQDAYDGIAYVYETEEEWDQALQYGLKSLSLSEKSPSTADKAYSYHQLGSVYLGIGENLKAELYLKKAKSAFLNGANTERVGVCDVDLAKVYFNLHYYNLAKTYLDSAAQLFLELREQIQLAETYQQLGKLALKQQAYNDADNYYNLALDIYKNGGAAPADYNHALLGLGEVAFGKKDYAKALQLFKNEYLKASGDGASALDCLLYLSATDSAMGNFKEALGYLQQYRVLYKNVYNEKKNRATERLLIEFDVERQNSDTKVLKVKFAEQQERLVIIITAAGVILIGALFLVLLYRQKIAAFKSIEKLQEETVAKNKEMLVANNVKDKLISMIAHDVRSPLASVQNTLTLTREEVITLEDFGRLSQMLEMDIQHLSGMLDNTLMWAREQMIDITIKKVNFNIRSAVEDVLTVYQQTITSKGVNIHNNIAQNTEVVSDKDIITTVLRNIISNAIKFTPQGKNIFIEQTNIKSKVLISVKDEGVGISDDVLKKINNREFISTRGTDNEKGTGLGLLFSNDLLQKLGEDFQVSSVPNKGTAVTISLATKK